MFIARVVGSVWATRKSPSLERKRLLLVQPVVAPAMTPGGKITMAVCHHIDAGVGDLVLILDEGGSARMILGDDDAPVRTIVVGVIDRVYIDEDAITGSDRPLR